MFKYTHLPTTIQHYIDNVIKTEGGYVNDPNDDGGETKYGITKTVAEEYSYAASMEDLPLSLAQDIYADGYWGNPKLYLIAEVSELLAEEVFEAGVNCGTQRAVAWLQEELNLFNDRGTLYDNIVEDGYMGSGTQAALQSFFIKRAYLQPDTLLYNILNCNQHRHYKWCATNGGVDDKDESFYAGWCAQRLIFK